MIFAALLGLSLAVVPVFGGSLPKLARLRFRLPGAIVAAFAIQLFIVTIAPDGSAQIREGMHVLSYVLIAAFLTANRRTPGMLLIGSGALLNATAIVANHGVMPASPTAYAAAGLMQTAGGFSNSTVISGAHLRFLGDIFSVPRSWPLHNVFSVGDVVLVVGVLVLVFRTCGVKPLRRSAHAAPQS